MRLRYSLWFCFPLLIVSILSGAAGEEQLPAPELTEQWTPVPPVVQTPANGIPSDAIVLFDGKNLDAWQAPAPGSPGWKIEGGAMIAVPDPKQGDLWSKESFGDIQLHLEFRTPTKIEGSGQGRGNSGVFFMGLYELQILDSWQNSTYVNGQAGSIYKQYAPLVNPCRPPGEWQTYDVVFIAPRFSSEGKLLSPAHMTVFYNGVLVQYDAVLRGRTLYRGQPYYKAHADKLPLKLQYHHNPIAFRNIWVRPITVPGASSK